MSQNHKLDLGKYKLIIDTIFDATDPVVLGTQMTHLLITAMGVKGSTVFVVNPITEELEILATEGLSLAYRNKGPILVDKSITLSSNQTPIVIADTETSTQLQYPVKAKEEGVRAIVSIPVKLKGKVVAALRVYHSEVWKVTDQELAFLELIARHIGMALRYFRLSSAVATTRETMSKIHSIWL